MTITWACMNADHAVCGGFTHRGDADGLPWARLCDCHCHLPERRGQGDAWRKALRPKGKR